MMSLSDQKYLFIFVWLIITLLTAEIAIKPASAKTDNDDIYRQLTLFGDVFQRVRKDYVEVVTEKDLIEAAINGMLTSLDPHSAYLPDDHFKKMQVQTTGKFGGLGIEVTMEGGVVKIVSPIDDTPAARAGLQPEDYIISVDGDNIVGSNLAQAVEKLRGPIGSDVKITIQRAQQEPFDLVITRDEIKIKSVRSRLYDNIGYIRITTFSEQTSPGLYNELDALKQQSGGALAGLVLDLRNNPGGLLSEAIKISDAFLEAGEIVSTRGRDEKDSKHSYARAGDIAKGIPIIVLINSGSASASEIVAGALKDHKRAILMGTRTFGKGSVQTITPISGHGAIRLTTARYFTPSGISIQAKGIEPDINVALARIEKLKGGPIREEDLQGALDGSEEAAELNAKTDIKETPEDAVEDPAEIDYQLARALDLLRGLSVFSASATNNQS